MCFGVLLDLWKIACFMLRLKNMRLEVVNSSTVYYPRETLSMTSRMDNELLFDATATNLKTILTGEPKSRDTFKLSCSFLFTCSLFSPSSTDKL